MLEKGRRENKCLQAVLLWSALAVLATAAFASGGTSAVYGDCPTTGYTASANTLNLEGECVVDGNINLSGNAALTMTNGTLGIMGNVVLSGNAKLTVTNGGMVFPQTGYGQYSLSLNGNSQLTLKKTVVITNGTGQNNFSMLLAANDSAVVTCEDSGLDPSGGSWLLGNFNGKSTLRMIGAQNLPTEIYPFDKSRVSISAGSNFAALWLEFMPGSKASVQIPSYNAQGNYNFNFGPAKGIDYAVRISSSRGRLGLNSHPDSNLIVNGRGAAGANDVDVVFGYYVENSTGPVSINGLNVDGDITEQFTDQGRNFQLNHVNLGPFSWQVYVSESNHFPVSISNSKINEIGVLTNGLVDLSNSVLQLAVTEAGGPGSSMNISNTEIWSQSIQAVDGGQLTISDSILHGNFIAASGAGSSIVMNDVGEGRNGIPPQSCAPVDGFPPNNDGVPLCNPFNPLYQCSQVVPPTGGATITATPPLTCPPE